MALNKKPTGKLFYKISEVAKMFAMNISAVRYWEKEFEILNPKKNKKGNRLFTPKDIKNLQIIYHLVKERGFTIEGAKKKLTENKEDTIDNIEIVNHLRDIRGFLVNLREEL